MRRFLLFGAAMIGVIAVYAQDDAPAKWWDGQTHKVEKFEGEVFGSMNMPFDGAEFGDKKLGWGIGGELRYNFSKLPVDAGIQLAHITNVFSEERHNLNIIAATGDWNFAQGEKLNPFAGLGVGMGFTPDRTTSYTNYPMFVVMPRIGIEYNGLMRLSLSAPISQNGYSCMQMSLGLVMGGKNSLIDKESGFPKGKTPEYYTRLSKRQRGIGWGLLGVGVPMVGLGVGVIIAGHGDDSIASVIIGGSFMLTGTAVSCASIPLFVSAHKSKKKAAELSLGVSALTTPGASLNGSLAPALSLNF